MQSAEAPARVRTGWAAALARATAAILLFELLTGLAITFGPFHPAVEWGLLLHTGAGLLAIAPLVWYFVRHWRERSSQAFSDVMLLGYVGLIALAVCVFSGFAVTAQGLLATRTAAWLRYVHLGSTLIAVTAAVPHILLSWLRRRGSEFARPAAGWLLRAAGASAAGACLTAGLTLAYPGTRYRNEFPRGYNLLYGKTRPFAPSLAHTSTNGAFDARSLSGSATCGSSGCHTQIYKEWEPSAHRYAAMDPIFQGIQNVMAKQNGPESTRYCGGCHDPISLFSGAKNISSDKLTGLAGYNEGISCMVCHSIQKTDIQGNADYILAQTGDYLWQWSGPNTAGAVARNFLIRTWPAHHRLLNKRMYKKPEYCAACHKQFIDREVNRVGWVQLQNQYDNWAASHWNKKGDARTTVECRECHMPIVDSTDPAAGDATDYNRSPGDHKHRSHRFLAANSFVPALLHLEGAREQVKLTERWLRGRIEIPEIRNKWAEGPIVKLRIEVPATATPGRDLPVRVVLVSNKVGHDFPTGPLDMIQSWVELRVEDDSGRIIFASGRRDARNFLEPGTFLFKAEPVDQYGNLIDHHNLWEMVGVRYRRSLFPGYADTVKYSVPCRWKRAGSGPRNLSITATLHYRKIDQFLLNYVMGGRTHLTAPVVDIASATAQVPVGPERR